MAASFWNPELYAAFRGLRLRPALDLLAQAPEPPPGEAVDLGCGDGAVAEALRARFPDRLLTGLDSSPEMLARAKGYDRLEEADIARWTPATPPALIFSNAALQWLPDHAALLPRLAGLLAPGGVLAAQMPTNFGAPSHVLLRETAAELFAGRFPQERSVAPVHPARSYHDWLAPLGRVEIWETEYLQELPPDATAHPVRRFTEGTAMRPYLAALSPEEGARLTAAYDAALAEAYPLLKEGGALFPFRRLFLILRTPG
ncbi:methyltransferase domain-containing protein [Neomegalonema sp.]|uniref:methyltransferase domain-containing protein n=1 Tax=Neomegalonema sp. TaxID=2039713 RepID=UPI002618C0DC|nr:methyltransferase domain-containing protein [Neomegalonema sp.]MDD2868335.1 methyltransferase domain-containing protein [Neomegalonema sp.]